MTSLRRKLDRILASSTLLALAVAGLLLLAFSLNRDVNLLPESVRVRADMIALATAPALSFLDRREARENLAALRADPNVMLAALYDPSGELFASYMPADQREAIPSPPSEQGMHFGWRAVQVVRDVTVGDDRVGTLYLWVRHGMLAAALESLLALALIMAASLAAALLLSHRLHMQAMAPLRAVSQVARDMLAGRMRRLPKLASGDEESDSLADAFNAMLDQLEQRSRTLQDANEALRASEERYQLVVRGTSAGLWDWDLRTDAVFYAPRFKALLGYTEDDFPEAPRVQEMIHPDDRPEFARRLRQQLKTGLPFQMECRAQHRDGHWRWFLVTGMAERDASGRAFRMAGSIVDVSERKLAEQVLHDANRTKDEFLATLAHELRNPLAPIRSGLDILQRDSANGPVSQRARQTMERQLMHMIRLVDDLMDISRINSGKIQLSMGRVDLARVVETAVELSRPAIAAAGHELVLDVPAQEIELMGDATRLAQALGNLLNNAARYTPHGGRIELHVRQEGLEAVIEVRDNGMGIPEPMLEQVFSLFTQVERRTERAQGGLGIGLYLVRSLVELHHGQVIASSGGENQGSTFTMRLPCLPAAPAGSKATQGGEHRSQGPGRKVLVIDDNVDAAETLVTVLDMLGHDARAAHDGESGLALAAEFDPDIVLLDIGLPMMDGYEVARRMRADARQRRAVLVAVTGWGSEEDRRRASDAGFDRHLTKPVDIDSLEPVLAQLAPG